MKERLEMTWKEGVMTSCWVAQIVQKVRRNLQILDARRAT
jgi:hypothetical protein